MSRIDNNSFEAAAILKDGRADGVAHTGLGARSEEGGQTIRQFHLCRPARTRAPMIEEEFAMTTPSRRHAGLWSAISTHVEPGSSLRQRHEDGR